MKKKILATLLSITVILVTVCIPVSAETFSDTGYSVDYANSKVSISTTTGIPNINTSLIVLNDGKTLADVSADANAAIQYQTLIKTDENGKINFIFPLDLANKEAGYNFKVYAKIPGDEVEEIDIIEYKSKEQRLGLINGFQKEEDDQAEETQVAINRIKGLLEDEDNRKLLGIKEEHYDALDKDLLAARMLDKFDAFVSGDSAGDAESFQKACECAREIVVLELFNQSKADLLFDESGNYLCEDMLDFAKHDAKYQMPNNFYAPFKNMLSNAGKKAIAAKLIGKNYPTVDALYKDFAINTILIGLTNPKDTGYAQVEVLLSSNNRTFVGLTFGTVTDEMEVKIAAHSGFSSLQELTDFVASLAQSSGGGGGGGSRPTSNVGGSFGGGAAAMQPVVPPVETPTVVFKDIPDDHWAIEGIAYLKAKNVINGVSSDSFDPNGLVTREQLVKMIFAITGLELVEGAESLFTDVPAGAWYTDYVVAMNKEGYINGVSETEFGIGQYATRQDICTIVNRILGLGGSGIEFSDDDAIAEYASEAVAALAYNKIVNGYPDGSFRPNGNCTRAEAATIIYRASKFAEVK